MIMIIDSKKRQPVGGQRVKISESLKTDKYQDLASEQKKTMEYESDGDTNCNKCTRKNPQRLGKGNEIVRNQRTFGDHPNYYIIEIGQNTEKSPGDLRRPVGTQTPMKDHQLT